MKAPNGNPTNLTERQWLQVRTKAFKDWFGDWETANKENPYNKDISIGFPEADLSNVDGTGIGVLIPIFLNGEYIGETGLDNVLYHKDKGISIKGKYMEMPSVGGSNITIEKEYRGKGYGKAAYFELAKFAANNGKILRSAPDTSRTPASTRVWESLVRDGYAKRVNYRYEIINSTLNNASKVIDENGEPRVVYHGSNEYGFNIFDPSKSDDKISLFASSSKWIASTYTSFKPLENALVRKALLKGNAIDLIKNEDWKSLEKLINSIINFNLPRPIEGGYPLPYGNEKILDEILTIRKELNKPNLTEEEHLSLLADLTKAEDEYYYSRNYTFKVKKKTFHDKTKIEISIDDSYNKEFFSSHYIEEGVIFRGSPKELIESLTFDTKVYDLFLNIKNPLILDNQVNEFGHANNWNGLYFSPAAKEVQNTDLWGNKMLGTHKQTKTRDVAEYAKKNNYDGVIFKQIADRGGYPGYQSLNPMTDADFLYEDMHIGEDSFNATNKLESDIFIAFNSNNIKSATDNIGAFSTKDDNIYNSDTIEEYETVASIGDYIQSYSPEDRAEIAREINNGNISIKCK